MFDFLQQTDLLTILSYIFGFSAMIVAFIAYQSNKHKSIMLLTVLCGILWCCHFICLKTYTGAAMNLINVIRSYIYSNRDKKWTQHKFIPWFFLAVSLGTTALTYGNMWSALPFIASVFAIFGNWQTNTSKLRWLTYPVCACWLTYNIINHSIPGAVNEVITIISLTVSVVRYDILKKKQKNS